jgi:hypothetical protein
MSDATAIAEALGASPAATLIAATIRRRQQSRSTGVPGSISEARLPMNARATLKPIDVNEGHCTGASAAQDQFNDQG